MCFGASFAVQREERCLLRLMSNIFEIVEIIFVASSHESKPKNKKKTSLSHIATL